MVVMLTYWLSYEYVAATARAPWARMRKALRATYHVSACWRAPWTAPRTLLALIDAYSQPMTPPTSAPPPSNLAALPPRRRLPAGRRGIARAGRGCYTLDAEPCPRTTPRCALDAVPQRPVRGRRNRRRRSRLGRHGRGQPRHRRRRADRAARDGAHGPVPPHPRPRQPARPAATRDASPAWFWLGYALARYAQGIHVARALAQGLGAAGARRAGRPRWRWRPTMPTRTPRWAPSRPRRSTRSARWWPP